jgi:hypothetical protein
MEEQMGNEKAHGNTEKNANSELKNGNRKVKKND